MTWYDDNAAEVATRYEALEPQSLHAWMSDLLPGEPSLVVDVGAGTGRDAAWFAAAGHEVIAIEPSSAMRAEGRWRHDVSRVTWVDDSLPSLPRVAPSGLDEQQVELALAAVRVVDPGAISCAAVRVGAPPVCWRPGIGDDPAQ